MEQPEALDIPKGIFNNNKVCAFVSCHFCERTRCIYSIIALTSEQKDQVKIYIDQARYTCGECLFPQEHQFGGLLFTKQALTCDSPIETGYYSSRLQKDQLCYYCGSGEYLIDIDDKFLENYQSVYPLCSNCEIGGHKIHIWGKKKVPQKRQRT